MARSRPPGAVNDDGAFDAVSPSAAPGSVVSAVIAALHRHGFVLSPPLDLQRELRDRVGAYLVPYVVLFTFNPAYTHRVLRHDPAAAAMTIMPVVIRGSGGRSIGPHETAPAGGARSTGQNVMDTDRSSCRVVALSAPPAGSTPGERPPYRPSADLLLTSMAMATISRDRPSTMWWAWTTFRRW
jgi:hypothetical protein